LPDRRRVRQSMISLVPRLHKKPHKAILGPGSTGFPTKKSADRCAAAVNFVFFHSHIHIRCPWISSDHVDLQAKNLLEQFRNIEAGAADSRGTAARGFASLAKIAQCFVRLIRADKKQLVVFFWRSNPGEFAPVKLNFLATQQLGEIDWGSNRSKSQSVWFSYTIDIIGGSYGPATGHILHDDIRLPRNLFGQVMSDYAGVEIAGCAGGSADDNLHLFTFVEIALRLKRRRKATDIDNENNDSSHLDHLRRLPAFFASAGPTPVIPVPSQLHFLPPVNGVSGCAAMNSSHARIPSLLKACKKDHVEALRT